VNAKDKAIGFLVKHKWALIITTSIFLLAILFLIVFASGPQTEPFRYRIS